MCRSSWFNGIQKWSASNNATDDDIKQLLLSARVENIEKTTLRHILEDPFVVPFQEFRDKVEGILTSKEDLLPGSRTIYLPVDGYAFHTEMHNSVIQYDNSIGLVINFRDSSIITKVSYCCI